MNKMLKGVHSMLSGGRAEVQQSRLSAPAVRPLAVLSHGNRG